MVTILHGSKIKLYPTGEQTLQLDLWRRRSLSLWNLLLGLEQAAYSGENFRPELHWRQIWAEVAEINHKIALAKRPASKSSQVPWGALVEDFAQDIAKRTGIDLVRARIVSREDVVNKVRAIAASNPDAGRKQLTDAIVKGVPSLSRAGARTFVDQIFAKKPVRKPLAAPELEKITSTVDASAPPGERPRLFIWENDLMKLMARLKSEPLTKWIGELHSHGCQAVCKDLIRALQTMIKERKKTGGRDVGFPKFKKAAYAAGSVYFANTQLKVDFLGQRIAFPHGMGEVRCGQIHGTPGSKLMGARAWREGEQWWLSAQFEAPAPDPLPSTGREAGVKIAASVLATVFDGRTTWQVGPYEVDASTTRRLKLTGRKEARRRDAAHAKAKERAARKERQGKPMAKKPRVLKSKNYFEAAARIAQLQAYERNGRNDLLHKTSRTIVDAFDTITVERMNVASLMAKPEPEDRDSKKLSRYKNVRKLNRTAAMARELNYIKYKAAWGGRILNETEEIFPRVQECSVCGALHPEMKDGRRQLRCQCGNVMDRRDNAAVNIHGQGEVIKKATKALTEEQPAS